MYLPQFLTMLETVWNVDSNPVVSSGTSRIALAMAPTSFVGAPSMALRPSPKPTTIVIKASPTATWSRSSWFMWT